MKFLLLISKKNYSAKSSGKPLGGNNHHADQCQIISEEIDPVEHGIHFVPCYKMFTLILSKETHRSSVNSNNEGFLTEPRPKRAKLSHVSNVYPKECKFCKKYRIMKKNRIHFPKTVCTDKAVQTIRDAAESKVFTSILQISIWSQGNLNTTNTAIRSTREKKNLLLSKPRTNDRDLWAISSSEEMYRRENSFPKSGDINAHLT